MTRKEVIKGLECCLGDTRSDLSNLCTICPYARNSYATRDCSKRLREDALALLKEQEPRVMTLDELSEKTDVWFESLVYDTIDPALSSGSYGDGTVGLMTLGDELFYMDEADYGTKWRCWTSCPDEKRRVETPWN